MIVPSCKSGETDGGSKAGVIVTVNGASIMEDDLYLRTGGGHGGNVTPEMRQRLIDSLVDQELLYQNGVKLGLDKDQDYRNAVRILEMKLRDFRRAEMARRVASTRIASTVNVTSDDVNHYIEANVGHLKEEYHLAMMSFSGPAEADSARARIVGGEPFEKVATSQWSYAAKMGKKPWDLGYLHWYQVPGEWQEEVSRLGRGEISKVLYGNATGYCIVKVIDKRTDPKFDPRSASAAIMNRLRDDRVAEAYKQYVDKLKQEAAIKRFDERRE